MTRSPRIFVSAGEPSGDLHGSNLVEALRHAHPGVQCEGFGGERMQAAGCDLLYPLAHHAAFGLLEAVRQVGFFKRQLDRATEHMERTRPDAVVLIDCPGFNWWMASRAKGLGIPVVYFVPPQIWAWASWRVRKMRRYVDRILCTLPFERNWYRCFGLDAPYIGHPYFDALQRQTLDDRFLGEQRARPGTVIAILPGSRRYEIKQSFLSQARAAAAIHAQRPETRFLVACFKQEHAEHAAAVLRRHWPGATAGSWSLPLELHVGRTAEIIELAHSCIAVSGSVGLELLHACKPAVILYRIRLVSLLVFLSIRKVNQVSLVNLMAGRQLYPEYVTSRCPASRMARDILHWLEDGEAHERLRGDLQALRDRVAQPGACDRAAAEILQVIDRAQAGRRVRAA